MNRRIKCIFFRLLTTYAEGKSNITDYDNQIIFFKIFNPGSTEEVPIWFGHVICQNVGNAQTFFEGNSLKFMSSLPIS